MLASESPRRKALLAQAGVIPDLILPADIDEREKKGELPRLYVLRLAREKAATIAAREQGALVLAADTAVALGRRILPKAMNNGEVRECLERLSGRRHVVVTAVALAVGGAIRTRTVETRVAFKRLTQQEIDAYVQCGEGVGKAGGYAIQGRAEAFVRLINGSYSNIVGLPLAEAVGLLRAHGFPC